MRKTGLKKAPWLFPIMMMMFGLRCWLRLVEGSCTPQLGCSPALAYYEVQSTDTLDTLALRFQTTTQQVTEYNSIADPNTILTGDRLFFPFPCQCLGNSLGYSFLYNVQNGDTVDSIAVGDFERLTTDTWIAQASNLENISYISPGQILKIPVNCSCGNLDVSPSYGLFTTYPASTTDNVSSLSTEFEISESLLRQYNPSTNWNGYLSPSDIIFIPTKDAATGQYPPYNNTDSGSGGKSNSLAVGLPVGIVCALLLFFMLLLYLFCARRRAKRKEKQHGLEVVPLDGGYGFTRANKTGGTFQPPVENARPSGAMAGTGLLMLSDFTVDKSVEFSFEELAAATNNFSVANKIGEGGYGSVYFAELRGQKLAVKRMNLQATREFLAELQVLTHVHHTNLVQLIGYCTVDSLFLIYEYVENGTLDRHLHGSHDLPPLAWSARVQIALDTARGLEYIHEHTKPTYIHRDVKSSNILIDRQFHAKVADFGLTKLTESSGLGSVSLTMPTRLVGTFGYMSPEYARYGDVSPKVDVYSFGVVLFEIISAKEAIVRTAGTSSTGAVPHKEEQKGLVTLFEDVLKENDGNGKFRTFVDPALGDNYPLESAWKMAQLAGACTKENPELRPSMRTAVVALMTLSSSTQDWELSAYGSDRTMTGLMSGR